MCFLFCLALQVWVALWFAQFVLICVSFLAYAAFVLLWYARHPEAALPGPVVPSEGLVFSSDSTVVSSGVDYDFLLLSVVWFVATFSAVVLLSLAQRSSHSQRQSYHDVEDGGSTDYGTF